MKNPRRSAVVFFRTANGAEIVLEWLRSLDNDDRRVIGQDLMRLQFRWPVGMPLCRSLGDGLWELRSSLTGGRIAQVLFCFTQGRLVALHGFLKTTRKTPAADLTLARKRMNEFL